MSKASSVSPRVSVIACTVTFLQNQSCSEIHVVERGRFSFWSMSISVSLILLLAFLVEGKIQSSTS